MRPWAGHAAHLGQRLLHHAGYGGLHVGTSQLGPGIVQSRLRLLECRFELQAAVLGRQTLLAQFGIGVERGLGSGDGGLRLRHCGLAVTLVEPAEHVPDGNALALLHEHRFDRALRLRHDAYHCLGSGAPSKRHFDFHRLHRVSHGANRLRRGGRARSLGHALGDRQVRIGATVGGGSLLASLGVLVEHGDDRSLAFARTISTGHECTGCKPCTGANDDKSRHSV